VSRKKEEYFIEKIEKIFKKPIDNPHQSVYNITRAREKRESIWV